MEEKLVLIKKSLIELIEELTERTIGEDELNIPFSDLGVDSLMALEIAVHLERQHGVRLGETELGYIQNIKEILDIVKTKVAA